ncbi:MAG: hypothetical protein D6778_03005 [Nitrospirae bacterium]|nr:MAG: hypothetical protein D6778_03005 [Nitrospirota bacterium]
MAGIIKNNKNKKKREVAMAEKGYLQTFKEVILSPRKFYSEMERSGGLGQPAGFFFLMVLVGMIINVLGTVFLFGKPVLWSIPVTILVFTVLIFLIGFGIAFVLCMAWKLLGSKEKYETAFRCFAYSSAISPFTSVIAFVPVVGYAICVAWIVFLLIIASEQVHGIKAVTARAFWATIGLLVIIGSVALELQYKDTMFNLSKEAQQLSKELQRTNP